LEKINEGNIYRIVYILWIYEVFSQMEVIYMFVAFDKGLKEIIVLLMWFVKKMR